VNSYDDALQRIREEGATWLVTGTAGFIGSHLAETLLKLDQKVVGLDNFSTGKRANLAHLRVSVGDARWKRFSFIEGDIRSLETCRAACAHVDRVLHQAALGSVPRSIDDPIASTESNVAGFLNMLVAARDANVRSFVYASAARDFCYVDNVVQANLLASMARDPEALGQAYNIALGEMTSLNDLFEIIRAQLLPRIPELRNVRAQHREPRRGDIQFSRADIGHAKRMLGFDPKVRIRDGLAKTIEWYAANVETREAKKVAHA
jgi:nucleoside-diphosphate-sugar epimerase